MEADILYEQLADSDSQDDLERTLTSLIHASFEDESTTISYFASNEIYYEHDWVDAGRFILRGYNVEKKGIDAYRVNLACDYDERLPQEILDGKKIDFFDTIEGHILYRLSVQVGPKVHVSNGRLFVVPKP